MFNATFLGEMLTFAVLIWVTMKYIWPPIMQAINDRQQKIAEGLAAAERGQRDLELARERSVQIMQQAKSEAQTALDHANYQANTILERSHLKAKEESARVVQLAKGEIKDAENTARQALQQQTAELTLAVVAKLLQNGGGANSGVDSGNNMTASLPNNVTTTATATTATMPAINQQLVEQLIRELKSE